MKIIIKDDYSQLSKHAAQLIAEQIRKKPNSVIGLATGGTPLGTYKELIRLHKEEGLDFSQVRTFNLDEYLGLAMDLDKSYEQDQSYERFMYEELFFHINIKKENIHIPYGLTSNPEETCKEYEENIEKAGGIDLQLLGIGGDGHWAFNEPGSAFDSRTRVESLHPQTTQDNYKAFFQKSGLPIDQMPTRALTMGIATILEAKSLLMLAYGKNKANIIKQALEGPITTQVSASAIQIYKNPITIILDSQAASQLERLD
ncbi:MAG: glucosamine-6-phosphate deaminase [Tissierellales bacterium]